MNSNEIILPSKPRVVTEEDTKGVYEIDGLYAGYGHTLGNSLRRVVLSSLPGAAITTVKIEGINHEFSTIPGIKEDLILILLNLKQVRFKMHGDEPQTATLQIKGVKKVYAGDFKMPSQLEILNKDKLIVTLTSKTSQLNMEVTVEKGLGYVPREILKKEKVEVGTLMLDAIFTPIRRVNYEVENMRVGERTDYNRLRFFIETDGSIAPREALETAVKILIKQLNAVVDIAEEKEVQKEIETEKEEAKTEDVVDIKKKEIEEDVFKTRIEELTLSSRSLNALTKAGIRTLGGLSKKKEEDLLKVEGLGKKSLNEIRRALGNYGLILK